MYTNTIKSLQSLGLRLFTLAFLLQACAGNENSTTEDNNDLISESGLASELVPLHLFSDFSVDVNNQEGVLRLRVLDSESNENRTLYEIRSASRDNVDCPDIGINRELANVEENEASTGERTLFLFSPDSLERYGALQGCQYSVQALSKLVDDTGTTITIAYSNTIIFTYSDSSAVTDKRLVAPFIRNDFISHSEGEFSLSVNVVDRESRDTQIEFLVESVGTPSTTGADCPRRSASQLSTATAGGRHELNLELFTFSMMQNEMEAVEGCAYTLVAIAKNNMPNPGLLQSPGSNAITFIYQGASQEEDNSDEEEELVINKPTLISVTPSCNDDFLFDVKLSWNDDILARGKTHFILSSAEPATAECPEYSYEVSSSDIDSSAGTVHTVPLFQHNQYDVINSADCQYSVVAYMSQTTIRYPESERTEAFSVTYNSSDARPDCGSDDSSDEGDDDSSDEGGDDSSDEGGDDGSDEGGDDGSNNNTGELSGCPYRQGGNVAAPVIGWVENRGAGLEVAINWEDSNPAESVINFLLFQHSSSTTSCANTIFSANLPIVSSSSLQYFDVFAGMGLNLEGCDYSLITYVDQVSADGLGCYMSDDSSTAEVRGGFCQNC